MAIMSSPSKRMQLSEIYQWISEKYPYFKLKERSWRNSVRHNLSLNECFVKSGRSENGKGSYWSIHPANIEDFTQGDFRRRRARTRVRKSEELHRMQYEYPTDSTAPSNFHNSTPSGYVQMTTSCLSVTDLAQMFGMENVMSRDEQLEYFFSSFKTSLPLTSEGDTSRSSSVTSCNTSTDSVEMSCSVSSCNTSQPSGMPSFPPCDTSLPSVDISCSVPSAIPSLLSPVSPTSLLGPSRVTSSPIGQYNQPCSFQQNTVPVPVSGVNTNINNLSAMFPSPGSVEDSQDWY